MEDLGNKWTEDALEALERKIKKVYGEASKDMQKKADEYFAKFVDRDKKQQELLKAGKITEEQYRQWRLAQMGRGERFIALRDACAERMTEANKTAIAYVNDVTPSVMSLNHNYSAYTIEQVSGNVGFTLWDEQTVARMVKEDPTLLPKRRVNAPKDLKWNKRQFTAEITAGILQGESIGKIANRVQNLSDANRSGAIRNARTAVTGAQNAGRQASYDRAKEMDLPLRKRWVATKDNRTRHAHAMLDGQTVALDKPFKIDGQELMFPGDPTGRANLVWNCRCTMRTVEKEGIEAEPRQMRVRDPETGRNKLISEMTYAEWAGWKKKGTADNLAAIIENIRNAEKISDVSAIMQTATKKVVDLSGMDLDLAKENMEQLLRLGEEYGYRFSEVVTTSGRSALGDVKRSGAMADKVSLQYPKKYYKDKNALLAELRKSAAAGQLPRLGRRQIVIYTTTHEFAHTLSEELTSRLYGYGDELDFWDEIESVYVAAKKEKPEELGKYAFTNQNEFLAECFAYAKLGAQSNEYADKVLKIVDKYFRRKK